MKELQSVCMYFGESKKIFHFPETLHKQRCDLDLVTCCVFDLCTVHRNGIPWPVIYGVGVNVKTGDIFPATFTDKGPDLDIRNARTLTGGENVGVSYSMDFLLACKKTSRKQVNMTLLGLF